MDDDGFRAETVAGDIVHLHVLLEIGIGLGVGRTILATVCSSAVNVDSGLFARVEPFFLLQPVGEDLIVSFEEVTMPWYQLDCAPSMR